MKDYNSNLIVKGLGCSTLYLIISLTALVLLVIAGCKLTRKVVENLSIIN
ncbi:hypothetical protein B8V60_04705 [Streptococcus agalactiae]|nr:Hypothetical Protein GBS85147_0889 [Streptococcus agalactiae]KAF1102121.1 hypothetical protein B8U81_06305 [Streptococcus agalactiae]KAF1108450.1 hypothetical protein B8V09_02005 [Streptococcus agalactiae]KAF1137786.1 hypothetical protein B8V14_08075 [Streptococcus agalactiae]KAF1144631.1 hypothetical protein B8V13_05445 [Streptococcus agalactiae]